MAEERIEKEVDLYGIGETPSELRRAILALRSDYDSHNHDGTSSRQFQTLLADTISSRVFSIRKSSYTDDVAGFWTGLVGNIPKLYLGNATNYLKWDGSAVKIKGAIEGGSLNINDNAVIDSSGNGTFIGLTSLNLKAYTNFEAVGRFVVTGDVAPTFANNGMVLAPGAIADHYARALWWISNYVFANYPSFTCSLLALELNEATNDGGCWIGLGSPAVTGSGYTYNTSHAGFIIRKSAGTVNVGYSQNNGTAGGEVGSNFTTIVTGDSLELFIKFTSAGVKYYYRKNGGALTFVATVNTRVPTASETNIHFSSTNFGYATDFKIQMQCAAYEH